MFDHSHMPMNYPEPAILHKHLFSMATRYIHRELSHRDVFHTINFSRLPERLLCQSPPFYLQAFPLLNLLSEPSQLTEQM